MAAPDLTPELSLDAIAIDGTVRLVKSNAAIRAVAKCGATWLESRRNITANALQSNLHFVGAAECEEGKCSKIDYFALPNLETTRAKDFILDGITCSLAANLIIRMEVQNNIKYLDEQATLTVSNIGLNLNVNMQTAEIASSLNLDSTNVSNGTLVIDQSSPIKSELNVTCCGKDSFINNSPKYKSNLPVFNSFSSRLV